MPSIRVRHAVLRRRDCSLVSGRRVAALYTIALAMGAGGGGGGGGQPQPHPLTLAAGAGLEARGVHRTPSEASCGPPQGN